MKKWEYQMTRYQFKDLAKETDLSDSSFYCDNKGQCFLHDTSKATSDMLQEAFNEEGTKGWELVQFGYHQNELLCVWKRALES
jgi:hypothetical protein